MIVIVSCAIENNLVYFYGYSGWVYDYDSFLVLFSGWLMIMRVSWAFLSGFVIMIVSWAIENNLIYFRVILAGSMIMIVHWAIVNNLVYF